MGDVHLGYVQKVGNHTIGEHADEFGTQPLRVPTDTTSDQNEDLHTLEYDLPINNQYVIIRLVTWILTR